MSVIRLNNCFFSSYYLILKKKKNEKKVGAFLLNDLIPLSTLRLDDPHCTFTLLPLPTEMNKSINCLIRSATNQLPDQLAG